MVLTACMEVEHATRRVSRRHLGLSDAGDEEDAVIPMRGFVTRRPARGPPARRGKFLWTNGNGQRQHVREGGSGGLAKGLGHGVDVERPSDLV